MRNILAALILLAAAAPAVAGDFSLCNYVPPAGKQQPVTVTVSIVLTPTADMHATCGYTWEQKPGELGACSMPNPDDPTEWFLVLDADLSTKEQACVLIYEKAHMPPNNWLDPAVETASAVATFAAIGVRP